MSDREDLLALFARMGVKVAPRERVGRECVERLADAVAIDSRANEGYGGFYAAFNFDADGNFVDVGIWE